MDERRQDSDAIRVRKRDGGTESFTVAKAARTIELAMSATGDSAGFDPVCVRGLAEAVRDYLAESDEPNPVRTSRIAELVELVLTQTGHEDAADAMIGQLRHLERQRRHLLVAAPRRSDGRIVQRRWRKAHVVQHLRSEHLLEAPAARMIAGRVEQLLFRCGLRVVTTGLITEMARSELLAWGLLPGALVTRKRRSRPRGQSLQDKLDRT